MPPTARTYGVLTLGTLAFILYGSLVPFEFRARPWGETVDAFSFAMSSRLKIQSRSDALANVMLGVPLGFSLLGLLCVDRKSKHREMVCGVAILPACVLFSAMVEFAQLYCPTRTCAGSDVLMQAIGVVIGSVGWFILGQWLTEQARKAWAGPRIGGSAGRLLVAYLALLACVQALPLDLTLSPRDVYKNVRDKVTYIPFGEFRTVLTEHREDKKPPPPSDKPQLTTEEQLWDLVRSRIEVVALYLPVGLLAGCLPGRFWQTRWSTLPLFGLGLLLGVFMESIQIFVMSRTPSATDVLIGAVAVVLGWRLAYQPSEERRTEAKSRWRIGFVVWLLCLFVANWQPFNFTLGTSVIEWLPLLPLEVRNPLFALQNLLTKVILFAPLGVAAACEMRFVPAKTRLGVAVGLGLAISLLIELGQLFLPTRTPSVTDVMIGGIGAWFGAAAASRAWGRSDIRGLHGRPAVY